MNDKVKLNCDITKFDEDKGLVFGWAIVCKINGQPYYDLQNDYIPEETMLDAATEFMIHSRAAGEMHKNFDGGIPGDFTYKGQKVGDVVFAFPMTEDITKACGIVSLKSGFLIGAKIENPIVLGKIKSGQYRGFSIEGKRLRQDLLGDDGEVEKTEEFNV